MKLPIKFRGIDCICDEYLFGDLIHIEKGVFIGVKTADGYSMSEVYPESVTQLCGYDIDGNEIYEDDALFINNSVITAKAKIYKCFLYGTDSVDGDFLTPSAVKTFKLRLVKEKHNE